MSGQRSNQQVNWELVEQRVKHNMAQMDQVFTGYDRLAAQHMFSEFCHLETIAVMAAERGDGIEGQLEDEYVHFETFKRLAEKYGGLVEPCPEVTALIEYLKTLSGPESLAALNVTAESWLETVFRFVANWGCADKMMRIIEDDEHRHSQMAFELEKPEKEKIEPVMRTLEGFLERIAVAPAFLLPLLHFGKEEGIIEMGKGIIKAHRKACEHFDIESRTKRVEILVRSQQMWLSRRPEEIEMEPWDQTKMTIHPDVPHPMQLWFEIPTSTNGYMLQAQLANSVARILQRQPRFRVVTRREKLFQVQESIVCMRALYDERAVVNVFLPGCEAKDDKGTFASMKQRIKRARNSDYLPMPKLPERLHKLLPPSRVAAAVNYMPTPKVYGDKFVGLVAGTGPITDMEGIPILVTLGEVLGGKTIVTIMMDHRTHDGQDIALFKKELESELMRFV